MATDIMITANLDKYMIDFRKKLFFLIVLFIPLKYSKYNI